MTAFLVCRKLMDGFSSLAGRLQVYYRRIMNKCHMFLTSHFHVSSWQKDNLQTCECHYVNCQNRTENISIHMEEILRGRHFNSPLEGQGRSLHLLKWTEKLWLLETATTDLQEKISKAEDIELNQKSVLPHANEHGLFIVISITV